MFNVGISNISGSVWNGLEVRDSNFSGVKLEEYYGINFHEFISINSITSQEK